MVKKVAILANGGDVAGFNAVIRGIVKTAENHDIECYGFIDGYNGLSVTKNTFLNFPFLISSASTSLALFPKYDVSFKTNLIAILYSSFVILIYFDYINNYFFIQ